MTKIADEKPKNTGRFGKGNPGKPKGAVNHNTRAAKDVIAKTAEMLGGAERMLDWVKEDPANERVFWGTIYTKLLPLQVTGDKDAPLQVQIVRFGEAKTQE